MMFHLTRILDDLFVFPVKSEDDGYEEGADGYWYKVHVSKASHTLAERECSSEGAHLAVPWSKKSNNVIHQMVKTKLKIHSIGNLLARIGINDWKKEGKWVAYNGSELTYTNWADGEPNNVDDEDCGTMAKEDGTWHDFSCHSFEPFICQKVPGDYKYSQKKKKATATFLLFIHFCSMISFTHQQS